MKTIKEIFDEIGGVGSTINKSEILTSDQDNGILKRVLYLALSRRIKFYIKQIPAYKHIDNKLTLEYVIMIGLLDIINRTITGDEAKNHLVKLLEHVTPDDAYIIERIIDKDPKI